jgi:hypothetical protein
MELTKHGRNVYGEKIDDTGMILRGHLSVSVLPWHPRSQRGKMCSRHPTDSRDRAPSVLIPSEVLGHHITAVDHLAISPFI